MLFIFKFHLFIGTTSRQPTEPRRSLSQHQQTSKRRTTYRHSSTRIADTDQGDRDRSQETTRHNARGRHGNDEPYDPYGIECETALNHDTARRNDRESLEILMHYFPSRPARLGNATTSTRSAAPLSSSFEDGFVVSSRRLREVHGLSDSLLDWESSLLDSRHSTSRASVSNDDSDVSNLSLSQRFPFQAQISGLLLRSIPDVLPPDPMYESDEDDDEEDVDGAGVPSRAGDALPGEVEVKQEDSTSTLLGLFEQLRRRDLVEGDVDAPVALRAISPAEKGLCDGYAVGEGASEQVSKPAAPSVTAENDEYIMVPSSSPLDPDNHDSEQLPSAEEIETSSLDEGGWHQFVKPANEPGSAGPSNPFSDSESTPDVNHAATTANDDGHLTKLMPGTRKPHYALPTTSFRIRNRPSSPSSTATPCSANHVANRAASLLHTARSITQDLKKNSRPSSRLSSSTEVQTQNCQPAIPGMNSRIPVAIRNAAIRIPSNISSRAETEVLASRSTSWYTAAATSSSPPSHVPGLSASLTPVIIRGGGGGGGKNSPNPPSQQVSAASLPHDADQTGGVRIRGSSSQSASPDGKPVKSASSESSDNLGLSSASAVIAADTSTDVLMSSNPALSAGDDDDDHASSVDSKSDSDSDSDPTFSSSGPGSDQCIYFNLSEPQDIMHGSSGSPPQNQGAQQGAGNQVPSSGVMAGPVEQDGMMDELEIVEDGEEWVDVSVGEQEDQGDRTGPFDVRSPAPKVWGQRLRVW